MQKDCRMEEMLFTSGRNSREILRPAFSPAIILTLSNHKIVVEISNDFANCTVLYLESMACSFRILQT